MSISGKLSDASVVEMVQFIGMIGRSGTLRVVAGEHRGTVRFCRGRIVGGARPGMHRLGDLLLGMDVIDARTLSLALLTQESEKPRRSLGTVLLAMGALTKEQISEAVRAQITDTIYAMVTWTDGSFEFVNHAVDPPDNIGMSADDVIPHVELDTQGILLDALRAVDENKRKEAEEAAKRPRPAAKSTRPRARRPAATPAAPPRAARPPTRKRASSSVAPPAIGTGSSSTEIEPELGKEMGLNDCIELGARTFMVQTEVGGYRELAIRTTVFERGMVCCAVREPYPGHVDDVHLVRAIIEAQHGRVMKKVRDGEIG